MNIQLGQITEVSYKKFGSGKICEVKVLSLLRFVKKYKVNTLYPIDKV